MEARKVGEVGILLDAVKILGCITDLCVGMALIPKVPNHPGQETASPARWIDDPLTRLRIDGTDQQVRCVPGREELTGTSSGLRPGEDLLCIPDRIACCVQKRKTQRRHNVQEKSIIKENNRIWFVDFRKSPTVLREKLSECPRRVDGIFLSNCRGSSHLEMQLAEKTLQEFIQKHVISSGADEPASQEILEIAKDFLRRPDFCLKKAGLQVNRSSFGHRSMSLPYPVVFRPQAHQLISLPDYTPSTPAGTN